jgi:Tol biopolymer transport system component
MRVRVLLQRSLQKDPKLRLRDVGDARISLDEVLSGAPDLALVGRAEAAAVPLWRRALPWAALAACLAIALGALAFVHFREKPPAPAEAVRSQLSPGEKITLAPTGAFALSPDGSQLAFAAVGSDGAQRIWIRALDSLDARPLLGSESSVFPAFSWSPDSRYIAFDAGGKFKKISISGGPAETICDLNGYAGGSSWNRDGVVIFGTSNGGLMRVSAAGGSTSRLTVLDPSRQETRHILPSFLPDGRHFIYLRLSSTPENDGVYAGSLEAKPEEQSSKLLVATQYGAAYVASSGRDSGQLLFVRDGTLLAQPFDARRLELSGEPVTVAEQIGSQLGLAFFSASASNRLVYRAGNGGNSQPTWLDREGNVLSALGEPGPYNMLALSPDGTRAAASGGDQSSGLWLLDFSRRTRTRFTFGPSAAVDPVWSPDGNRIIFRSGSGGALDLYQKLASGVKDEELLLKSTEMKYPTSWSRDGRFLLYTRQNPKRKFELWVLPLEGDKKPSPFLQTEFDERDGQFSPDGHWVAYVSDESGHFEIYVRAFSPDSAGAVSVAGGKWLISTNGGTAPRWRGDGKELYYLTLDGKLMAVEVTTNPMFRPGTPRVLFQAPQVQLSVVTFWDLTADGKRFLFPAPLGQSATPFTVVLNWQAALKK